MKLSNVICRVVVFDDLDNVLVIKRSMDDSWSPGEWEMPGGKAEDDEDYVLAASRELAEETGVAIAAPELHIVYGDTETGEEDRINRVWLYFAGRTDSEKVIISEEHSGYQWLPVDEAIGIIDHAITKKVLRHIKELALYPELGT